jgi:hypothetical protein
MKVLNYPYYVPVCRYTISFPLLKEGWGWWVDVDRLRGKQNEAGNQCIQVKY